MKRLFTIISLVLIALCQQANAQALRNFPPDDTTVTIDRTNLPIVWIDVDGATINRQDYIGGRMKIIHNGKGRINYGDTVAHPDQRIDYEGFIALRYRGNSSYNMSDKKPYQFRTLSQPLEEGLDKKKVSILGMGKDNKWALLAPYADKSMIRDLLGFEIARPWMEYTPQGRLCEVYLDGIYYGVYVLCEVVSNGKHRLNLDDPGEEGDALTGGYLMEVDNNDDTYYISKYHPVNSSGVPYTDRYILFQYKSPDYQDLTPEQINYIQSAIDAMEDAFASPDFKDPEIGYAKYIDVQNFIDYQLTMELSHNVDGYRLSGKFFKRRDSIDPRFKMVVWDLNLAFGNCRHNQGYRTDTWLYWLNSVLYKNNDPYMIPFWWYQLRCDRNYLTKRKQRWIEWRENNVRMDRLMATVDSLASEVTRGGAEERNAQAWPRWGVWVWPNYYVSTDYEDEIDHLKEWLTKRVEWLDKNFGYTAPDIPDDPPSPLTGDVNGDRQINIADVNVLIDIILGGKMDEETMARADVNEDGEVTIGDITAVVDLILNPLTT